VKNIELDSKQIPIESDWYASHELGYRDIHYELEGNSAPYELDAHDFNGSISTCINSEVWRRRAIRYKEIIKKFNIEDSSKKSMFSHISLGVKTINDNVVYLYIKLQEIGKRKILWTIWEKDRGKYNSYRDFVRTWDSNKGVWAKIEKDIRNDIREEVESLLGVEIKRHIKKSVKSEVDKLLREKQPFRR
jgi:hypothetical protein